MSTGQGAGAGGLMTVRSAGRRWSWPHFLALIAVPLLVLEVWTVSAWLLDGPTQITEYRDPDSASWYLARFFEASVIIISLVVLAIVIRDCRRRRQVLTFDVMFILVGATLFWADSFIDFYVPMWFPSSNWVNLNYVLGHMPFMANPDIGRLPDPLLFTWFLETFCFLGAAMAFGRAVTWARSRWPRLSNRQIFVLIVLCGSVMEIVLEICLMLPLRLWTYAAPEALTLDFGGGARLPVLVIAANALYFGSLVAIRIFKDDRGQTIVERGLDGYSPQVRKAISLLALYGLMQSSIIIIGNAPVVLTPYVTVHQAPDHIINRRCDAPGVEGTRYGPCPGSPGFRMPGRTSDLPNGDPGDTGTG